MTEKVIQNFSFHVGADIWHLLLFTIYPSIEDAKIW